MRKMLALMALTILTACDYAARRDLREERDNRLYREAMDDYRAGRMDAALAGFEKSIRNDPSNASARFQYACLLQDVKGDYLGAFCGYREYLMQHPESDKARMARDRLAVCEKELAKTLATRYGLNAAADAAAALETLRGDLREKDAQLALAEKNLGESQARVRALSGERDRLLDVLKGVSEGKTPAVDVVASADEDESTVPHAPSPGDVKTLLEEDGDESGSSLLPERRPEDLAPKPVVQDKKPAQPAPERPKSYVVKEGDTLYAIAKRFYGSISAWKAIRDANKARISADNRLKVGETLVLP